MQEFRKLFAYVCSIVALSMIFTVKVSAATNSARLGGNDRYETAVKVSQNSWTSSDYVILASGEDFPDALCSTPLAKKYNAPILLAQRDALDNKTLNEIIRLKAKHIIIVGGTGVVSENVKLKLESLTIDNVKVDAKRIAGIDRYATSMEVAKALGEASTAVVASGNEFADAISIAPLAAVKGMPILLSDGKTLTSDIKNYLQNSSIQNTYIVGGSGAIASGIDGMPANTKRLYGQDRFMTNLSIIKEFSNIISFNYIYIASGTDFPDALAGSAAAAKNNSPLFLAQGINASDIRDYIRSIKQNINNSIILGGDGALPAASVKNLLSEGPVTVTIDAGHGGYDTGAIGVSGVYEKDINLSVALKAGRILESNGINVVYTRTSDVVSWPSDEVKDLQARCDISNKAGANYFIAIHCNSFPPSSSANGTETYYFAGNTAGQNLASSIQNQLVNTIGTQDRGIKTANFYVLRNTDATSTLVELGFISNPDEEKLLLNPDYQDKCAQSIAQGFLKYVGR